MSRDQIVKNKDFTPDYKLLKLVNTVPNLPTIFLQFLGAQKELFQKA
jgi:hypothetical protein